MLGAHIIGDELVIDDPDMIARLEELAAAWGCTCDEALHRALECRAAELRARESPE